VAVESVKITRPATTISICAFVFINLCIGPKDKPWPEERIFQKNRKILPLPHGLSVDEHDFDSAPALAAATDHKTSGGPRGFVV
jgi:hypothetical protein